MNDIEYNLLDEKWILALDKDGKERRLSLKDVFADAHELIQLSGETPAQDFAVMRLLIAVLYAVYQRSDENGDPSEIDSRDEALRRWKAIWDRGAFDAGIIGSYLEGYRDRFYLFHPTRPFYQAPITKGTSYEVPKVNGTVFESGNKLRLFSPISGDRRVHMPYDEAARWILNINAYDDTSSKPTLRGVGLPSAGAGWVGKLGPVFMKGSDLFETLMLNFVLFSDYEVFDGDPFPIGVPTWEPEEARTEERVIIPVPGSPVEILTLQSRRLLLSRDDEGVTGCLLMGGDIVPVENALVEQMTLWRQNDTGDFTPSRLDPARSMWRDYQSLLLSSTLEGKRNLEPGVIRWNKILESEKIIHSRFATVAVVGVKFGDKDFFVDDLVYDSLTINSSLLSDMDEGWNMRISEVISKTDDCVRALGLFALNISDLCGLDPKVAKRNAATARSASYYDLDIPFRSWLRSIDPGRDEIDEKMDEWIVMGSGIVKRRAKAMFDDACEKAIRGDGEKSLFTLYGYFQAGIRKAIDGGN